MHGKAVRVMESEVGTERMKDESRKFGCEIPTNGNCSRLTKLVAGNLSTRSNFWRSGDVISKWIQPKGKITVNWYD
jgi:hypothetical protein